MPRHPVDGAAVPTSMLPFSPAIRADDLVFVSGQASVDDNGTYVPGTFAEEMDRAIGNIARILAAAGGSLEDVVQVRSYLSDGRFLADYNERYRAYFTEPLPARTTLIVNIGDLKFEADVVAYIPAPPAATPAS